MIRVRLPASALLLFALQVCLVVTANVEDNLVRKRREWILPARALDENTDYTHLEYIARIRSDYESEANIHYSLEGIGANQYPFHVFVVDPKTGLIRVTKKLDRELIDTYNLSGIATYSDGREAEKKIDIRIKVKDENDNSPVFGFIKPAKVKELSPVGTSVTKVIATDADEAGNENSQISYSIIAQNPPNDMFYMNSDGTIFVNKPTLDRETQDQYFLTIKGQDLNGKPGGNTGTGTVTINIEDVNDNLPTLEKTAYAGSIEENTQGLEVMRLEVLDPDLKGTDNWDAVFDIVTGNEAGYFSIRTDPITNEGILMLDKPVDYEQVNTLDLGIIVKNVAPPYDPFAVPDQVDLSFRAGGRKDASEASDGSSGTSVSASEASDGSSGASGASGASDGSSGTSVSTSGASGVPGELSFKNYPIKIYVKNQPEGPCFDPRVKAIHVSEEDQNNVHKVIASYRAIDGDTGKPAENVRYAKGSDPDNWLTIDPTTAEIRLNKNPDRESKFLVNGTYIAKLLCITEDMPAKTATGTIEIKVADFNDHCPTLTSNVQTICTKDNNVIIRAEDEDAFPNGPPFVFDIVPEGTQGQWQVEKHNETAATLRSSEALWPGFYEVEVSVKDKQDKACSEPQKVNIFVCVCEAGETCTKRDANYQPNRKVELGPAGIGLLLLGLLFLLLMPLLVFFCLCGKQAAQSGAFTEMPFDTKSHLINYHTEGQGENAEVPLLNMPTRVDVDASAIGMGVASETSQWAPMAGFDIQKSVTANAWMLRSYTGAASDSREGPSGMNWGGGSFSNDYKYIESLASEGLLNDLALSDNFLRQYYTEKTASGDEDCKVKDSLLVYDYEGKGSPAGSVGCSSLLESDNDLQFLDDLGSKFKTLAELCGGQTLPTESKLVSTPLPNTSINTSVLRSASIPQPSPPKLQPSVPITEQTVVREKSERSEIVKENTATMKGGMTTVRQGMANQGQMLFLQKQQPVYYTTTPVLQPVQYVVQPQVQNTVLLAEAPTTNLQGLVLVNGSQAGPAQGVVVQGQTLKSSGQSRSLVNRSGIQGTNASLLHTGNFSGSQTMMVIEGKVPAVQPEGLSGSPKVLAVEIPTNSRGQLVQKAGDLSQKSEVSGPQHILYNTGSTFTGSQSSMIGSSTTTVSKTPSYRKVVVEETREIH